VSFWVCGCDLGWVALLVVGVCGVVCWVGWWGVDLWLCWWVGGLVGVVCVVGVLLFHARCERCVWPLNAKAPHLLRRGAFLFGGVLLVVEVLHFAVECRQQ
jgi:hypothetical protein